MTEETYAPVPVGVSETCYAGGGDDRRRLQAGDGPWSEYSCVGTPIGLNWTDAAPTGVTVLTAVLAFAQGVECAAASTPIRVVSLNGVPVATFAAYEW